MLVPDAADAAQCMQAPVTIPVTSVMIVFCPSDGGETNRAAVRGEFAGIALDAIVPKT